MHGTEKAKHESHTPKHDSSFETPFIKHPHEGSGPYHGSSPEHYKQHQDHVRENFHGK